MDSENILGRSRLEAAIREYECAEYELLEQVSGRLTYSLRYKRRMRALLRAQRERAASAAPFGIFGKRVAVLVLTGLLLVVGAVGVSGAKHSLSAWLTEVYERFTELFFSDRDEARGPDTVEMSIMPSFVPEGYTLSERYVDKTEIKTTWRNGDGEELSFVQMTLGSKTTLDHESVSIETAYVSDITVAVIRKKGKQCYYWSGKEYAFSLIAPDDVPYDVCLEMIGSVGK